MPPPSALGRSAAQHAAQLASDPTTLPDYLEAAEDAGEAQDPAPLVPQPERKHFFGVYRLVYHVLLLISLAGIGYQVFSHPDGGVLDVLPDDRMNSKCQVFLMKKLDPDDYQARPPPDPCDDYATNKTCICGLWESERALVDFWKHYGLTMQEWCDLGKPADTSLGSYQGMYNYTCGAPGILPVRIVHSGSAFAGLVLVEMILVLASRRGCPLDDFKSWSWHWRLLAAVFKWWLLACLPLHIATPALNAFAISDINAFYTEYDQNFWAIFSYLGHFATAGVLVIIFTQHVCCARLECFGQGLVMFAAVVGVLVHGVSLYIGAILWPMSIRIVLRLVVNVDFLEALLLGVMQIVMNAWALGVETLRGLYIVFKWCKGEKRQQQQQVAES